MGWGELVRRDLTSEVREAPEALLSDEIKNQLSTLFEPSEALLVSQESGISYYLIPGTNNKAAIAVISNGYTTYVSSTINDENGGELTVIAVGSKAARYNATLMISKSIEYILMSGPYACYGFRFNVDQDNPFYQSCDGALFSKDRSKLFSYKAREFDNKILLGVQSVGYMHILSNDPYDLTIPASVSKMDSLHINCRNLRFEGNLPELEDIADVRAKKIYVNQSLNEIPQERYEKITEVKHGERDFYRAEIITKKPVLSTEVPTAPGFIGLTRVDNDEYEYINPRYIVKMEPISFEKYDGKETGTRILYAAHGSERAIAVDYYEKLLDVDSRIKDAQEALAQSIGGLAGLLEKVNDLYNLSQDRF